MPDVFITLEEAAAFEGVSYDTYQKRVKRNPKQYNTQTQAREGGGKDQVLISVASLTTKARKAYRAAQKVDGRDVIIDRRAAEATPWYVDADLNHYIESNKKRFYEAVELAARVQDFIDYDGPDRTAYAERFALGLGVSPQTLYRYTQNVLEANAWALKMEKEDGQNRDYFRALALCREALEPGRTPQELLSGGLIRGMNDLGEAFSANRAFVPEMLMAARCMTAALGELKPLMTGGNAKTVGRACIGTVRGDMHDIGKNLVKIMLEGSGVEVIDLGVDVTPEQFVETAKRQRCGVIACSSLLTTTMGEMRRVVTLAREAGIRDQVKIFVGGAPISQSFCDEIGADVYTEDAAAAARAAVSALKG